MTTVKTPRTPAALAVAIPVEQPTLTACMCSPPGKTYGYWAQVLPGIWVRATAERTPVHPRVCAFKPDDIKDVDFEGAFGDPRADAFAKRIYGFARHRRIWGPFSLQNLNSYEFDEMNVRCLRVFANLGFLAKSEEQYYVTFGFIAEVLKHAVNEPPKVA